MSMNQQKIGKVIREIRMKEGLTQSELAELLGVSNMAVSKWETGKNIPDIELLLIICKKFNVDIEGILNGEIKERKYDDEVLLPSKKKKKVILIGISIILIIGLLVFLFIINKNSNFQFKTLTSNCQDFNLTGSMAYDKDKASIYISNINYCGTDEDTIYEKLACTLYEDYQGQKREISKCDSKEKISLSKFLESVTIGVDNYEAKCQEFSSDNLYLEISAIEGNKTIIYKVPITMNDNCSL